ncbi:MAG: hypothetical protein O3C40_37030, partial [Planctomycetota bacterium]|nr:hypothetical protein [Planctomycetota bacterium]
MDALVRPVFQAVSCSDEGVQPTNGITTSNSRLVDNDSVSLAKEQLASLAVRSDSMLAVDRCSLAFQEG